MKKIVSVVIILFLVSCSSSKKTKEIPLYEVLISKNDGGANIQFYEILTEAKEIKMLLADPNLKRKVKNEDLEKSNYLILNMGSKPYGKYSFKIEKVEETTENIIIVVSEIEPNNTIKDDENVVFPYSIVRINSKKPIIIN
jgi:hypothetical protein